MAMKKPANFIFIGRSGSGKGTQMKLLQNIFPNMLHVTTGDLFRDLSEQDTSAGVRIKEILDSGGLPFDQMATALWMQKIAFTLKEDQGLVCDGFPRRVREAQDLYEFLGWLGRIENTRAFVLNVSRRESERRMLDRKRPRDTKEDIKNRLDWYEERVVSAIDFLKEKGLATEINGEQTREAIHEDIKKALGL